jgi:hypothetical protein
MLSAATLLQRRLDPNAVAPYTWEAEYRDGRTIRQFDPVAGFQPSTRLDPQQILALRILGHPHGPIRVGIPYRDQPPDEIRIQATTDLAMPTGGTMAGIAIVRWFGFRYGTQWFLVRIDDAERVTTTNQLE